MAETLSSGIHIMHALRDLRTCLRLAAKQGTIALQSFWLSVSDSILATGELGHLPRDAVG